MKNTWKKISLTAMAFALLTGCANESAKEVIETPVTEETSEPAETEEPVTDAAEEDLDMDWYTSYIESASSSSEIDLSVFDAQLMSVLSQDKNVVLSPLNIYLALGTLAQCTDGNTRQQILDALHCDSMEELQEQIGILWNANSAENSRLTEKLATSLWLNGDFTFNETELDTLKEKYNSEVYEGDLLSDEMNQALRDWVNANTGDLLTDYTDSMQFTENTVMDLVSTIYYKAKWASEFSGSEENTFHGTNGDQTMTFLTQSDTFTYSKTEDYEAVILPLSYSGSMYVIMPEEGVEIDPLTVMQDMESAETYQVNLKLPEFDVQSQIALKDVMLEMGITDIFDENNADFSNLIQEDNIVLSNANHSARVMIDENGVTGAAYMEMIMEATAFFEYEEVDMTVDKPFLFVITGADGHILFLGTFCEVPLID